MLRSWIRGLAIRDESISFASDDSNGGEGVNGFSGHSVVDDCDVDGSGETTVLSLASRSDLDFGDVSVSTDTDSLISVVWVFLLSSASSRSGISVLSCVSLAVPSASKSECLDE